MAERLIEVAGKAVQAAMKEDADQAEAIACSIDIMTINIENGATRFSGLDQHQGIGLRVVKDNATGFSFVSNILDESINSVVTRALKVSSVKKSDPNFKSLPEPKAPTEVEGTFDADIANLSFEDAKGFACGLQNLVGEVRSVLGEGQRVMMPSRYQCAMAGIRQCG